MISPTHIRITARQEGIVHITSPYGHEYITVIEQSMTIQVDTEPAPCRRIGNAVILNINLAKMMTP